jgi:hypothetical protein
MGNQVFADGLGGILITGGMVRLDFVAVAPGGPEGTGQARLELQQRVVMPVDGFLRAAAKMQEACQALSRPRASTEDKISVMEETGPDRKAPFP